MYFSEYILALYALGEYGLFIVYRVLWCFTDSYRHTRKLPANQETLFTLAINVTANNVA